MAMYRLIVDYWRFIRRHLEYTDDLMPDAYEFLEQHGNSRYVKDLLLAFIGELDRKETET